MERRCLPGKARGHHFLHGAVVPAVGLVPQPLLGELIQMRPTLERTVADKEGVFDVTPLCQDRCRV